MPRTGTRIDACAVRALATLGVIWVGGMFPDGRRIASTERHGGRKADVMDELQRWVAAENEELVALETVFLQRVKDDDIRVAYIAARKGQLDALRTLTAIAVDGSQPDQTSPRQVQADKAIEMIRWFRMVHDEPRGTDLRHFAAHS